MTCVNIARTCRPQTPYATGPRRSLRKRSAPEQAAPLGIKKSKHEQEEAGCEVEADASARGRARARPNARGGKTPPKKGEPAVATGSFSQSLARPFTFVLFVLDACADIHKSMNVCTCRYGQARKEGQEARPQEQTPEKRNQQEENQAETETCEKEAPWARAPSSWQQPAGLWQTEQGPGDKSHVSTRNERT